MTRYRFDVELQASRVAEADVLPDHPGDEQFAAGVQNVDNVKELWAGITWARGLSKHVGFGITQFLSIRNQKSRSEFFAQALSQTGDIALLYDIDNYSADMYGLLWKVGLGFNFMPVTAGVTLTTPNLHVSGSGSATINETTIGIDRNDDGTLDNGFATNIQKNVTANYKSPLSIGVGAAWHLSKTKIHFSAEWFNKIDTYDVLELSSFVSQTTGETISRSLKHKSDSVINFGAGVEHVFNESLSGFLSFNTDQSSFNPESDVAVTGYDIYHAAGGANFALKRTELMLGIRYAWGSQTIQQGVDFNPDDGTDNDYVNLVYRQITFLIGFSVSL